MSDEKIESDIIGVVDGEAPLPGINPVRERRVVWKLDLLIAPVIMLLQLISYLDRSNIGFGATQGLSKDIHLQGSQFNVQNQNPNSVLSVTNFISRLLYPSSTYFMYWQSFPHLSSSRDYASVSSFLPLPLLGASSACVLASSIHIVDSLLHVYCLALQKGKTIRFDFEESRLTMVQMSFPALSLFLLTWYEREELAVRIAFLFAKNLHVLVIK